MPLTLRTHFDTSDHGRATNYCEAGGDRETAYDPVPASLQLDLSDLSPRVNGWHSSVGVTDPYGRGQDSTDYWRI